MKNSRQFRFHHRNKGDHFKRIPRSPWIAHLSNHKRGRFWSFALLTIGLSGLLWLIQGQTQLFRVSILQLPEHAPFDGTSMPIQSVPNWSKISDEERKLTYNNFPADKLIPFPEFNLSHLQMPFDQLQWGNEEHNTIRNEKITFSVVWAGNYKFDGKEKAGSHPGVDIKTLSGTPVFAIANGVVLKSSASDSGFGYHVVIAHKNVPSDQDENKKTTLYSGYAHLSSITVKEGDVVKKAQKIGEVGRTGTATTDHLHFQIDNDEAPWHLYFPFTGAQSREAGLNFFEAVNAGLGLENVEAYTVNPIAYVKKYLNYQVALTSNQSETTPTASEDTSNKDTASESVSVEASDEQSDGSSLETPLTGVIIEQDKGAESEIVEVDEAASRRNVDSFQIIVLDQIVLVGDSARISISAVDAIGHIVTNPEFGNQVISLNLTNQIGGVTKSILEEADFSNGQAQISIQPTQEGETRLKLVFGTTEAVSDSIAAVSQVRQSRNYIIEHDGTFTPGVSETLTIKALDEEALPAGIVYFGGILELVIPNNDGSTLSQSTFQPSDFRSGVLKVQFSSSNPIDYIFVLNLNGSRIYESPTLISQKTDSSSFSDLKASDPYYEAIQALYQKNVINGYPDGTFKSENAVSRVESLKFIYQIAGEQLQGDASSLPFRDIAAGQWYSKYVATAYSSGVVDGYPDKTFKPEKQVIEAEFLKMMFNALHADIPPLDSTSLCKDVKASDWFAPYVEFARISGIIELSKKGNCFPGKILSRGEVAQIIYRMAKIAQ